MKKIKLLMLCAALLLVTLPAIASDDCEDGHTPVGGRQCLIASPQPEPEQTDKKVKSDSDDDAFSEFLRWLKTILG